MRISTARIRWTMRRLRTCDSDIWDALVQLPASYDSLYLTYGDKRSRSFIFVEYEYDKYRLEHDTPELGLDLTNVARVSQQVARDTSLFAFLKSTLWFWMTTGSKRKSGSPMAHLTPETRRKRRKAFCLIIEIICLVHLQSLSLVTESLRLKMGSYTRSYATQTHVSFHRQYQREHDERRSGEAWARWRP